MSESSESEIAALSSNKDSKDPPGPEAEKPWTPSGSQWRDFLYFCGPGWFVSSKSSQAMDLSVPLLVLQVCVRSNELYGFTID